VFPAFTLSQWWIGWPRRSEPHWRQSLFFNATGAFPSPIVFVIAA
jgi:hypothetical protein